VNPVFEGALEIAEFCRSRQWRFCFIGGLAVLRWGEPRLTRDADLTLLTGFGGEAPYVNELVAQFSGRLDDTAGFALRSRVVLLRASNGTPLDIALGALPFEERTVVRASAFDITEGQSLLTCSAEDLVVHKTFAGRDRDWLDLEGVLVRQSATLDWKLILDEVRPLLELKDDRLAEVRLLALRDGIGQGGRQPDEGG
jgi:hypothetical protein